ncbi:hypothetical protein M404DRAFT_152323, partial [Pisolithus tinctorius Marx 270]
RITNQLRRLGGSYDWGCVAFTMDPVTLSKAVIETFCRLHEGGILYRANRPVNWCVKLNITHLRIRRNYLFCVPHTRLGYFADEKIVVATTGPETMLGGSAIAMHPDEPLHLHGKFAKHPFVDHLLPIVTDAIMGMKRFHARREVVKVRSTVRHYTLLVSTSGRKSGDNIEPILKPQWWVNYKSLAEEAIKVLITSYPSGIPQPLSCRLPHSQARSHWDGTILPAVQTDGYPPLLVGAIFTGRWQSPCLQH